MEETLEVPYVEQESLFPSPQMVGDPHCLLNVMLLMVAMT